MIFLPVSALRKMITDNKLRVDVPNLEQCIGGTSAADPESQTSDEEKQNVKYFLTELAERLG